MALSNAQIQRVWQPQPGPQTAFIHAPAALDEIMFGGARGGGKSDATLGKLALKALHFGADVREYVFRRELTQLEGLIARSKEFYPALGGVYLEHKKIWTFSTGAKIYFRFLDRDSDAEKVQGVSATGISFEELTNFPDPKPIMKLKGILRSVAGIPVQMLATSNPGGPGMGWVKQRYVDPAPMGWKVIEERDSFTGTISRRMFIPSRLTDNRLLMMNDPAYVARLAQTGSEALVKAWLDGDWNIIEGAFFDNWETKKHVIRTVSLPDHWLRLRAGDWGSHHPFAFCWIAIASEDWEHPDGWKIPKGARIIYRELYGSDGKNAGLKLPAEEVARMALAVEKEMGHKIHYGVMDPKAFSADGGPSIEERMRRGTFNRIKHRRADNKRVGRLGAMGGWDTLRNELGNIAIPMSEKGTRTRINLFVMDCCSTIIRTLPLAQHDPDNPEDLVLPEDHMLDAVRYGIMSRPGITATPQEQRIIDDFRDLTLNELWDEHEMEMAGAEDWRV